jgi:hypothetical protein
LERYQLSGAGQEHTPSAPRPIVEVVRMLKSQVGQLDLDYLRHWAQELKVEDLLEQALKQA